MNTVAYIAHGGGPLPLLGDSGHHEMLTSLKKLASKIGKPEVVIVVSAHWEEQQPSILSNASPPLLYDYNGFPDEAYKIQYPAKGEPDLAETVFSLLTENGFDPVRDRERGFDHGLFVPLKIMYPNADIPCLQVSLLHSLNPEQHISLGEALSGLPDKNILILGSGLSFHNMKGFGSGVNEGVEEQNLQFEEWLNHTIVDEGLTEQQRRKSLIEWESAPGARFCHPREEHLLPLHVCYGAVSSAASWADNLHIMNRKVSNFLWQS